MARALSCSSLQTGNEAKLEQMRATVDEKLHATLEARLGESFKQVAERLEQVHKGLGEMQGLAKDVGSLSRVLGNVKTRGIFGEVQLAGLLELFLVVGLQGAQALLDRVAHFEQAALVGVGQSAHLLIQGNAEAPERGVLRIA